MSDMSSLVSCDAAAFREIREIESVRLTEVEPLPGVEVGPTAEEMEIVRLKSEVARLDAALQEEVRQAQVAQEEAFQVGWEKGKAETIGSVERDERARVATLEQGVASAVTEFKELLGDAASLAAEFSAAALEPLFLDGQAQAERVTAFLERQLSAFHRESTLRVFVSEDDFASQTRDDLEQRLVAAYGVAVETDANLSAGTCRIELCLGCLELDLGGEWASVREWLKTYSAIETGG